MYLCICMFLHILSVGLWFSYAHPLLDPFPQCSSLNIHTITQTPTNKTTTGSTPKQKQKQKMQRQGNDNSDNKESHQHNNGTKSSNNKCTETKSNKANTYHERRHIASHKNRRKNVKKKHHHKQTASTSTNETTNIITQKQIQLSNCKSSKPQQHNSNTNCTKTKSNTS